VQVWKAFCVALVAAVLLGVVLVVLTLAAVADGEDWDDDKGKGE